MLDQNTLLRILPWALFAAAAVPLGTAYTAELGFGYEPCVLCLYQRVPYGLIMVLGFCALIIPSADKKRGIALIAAAVFAIGGGIALYHVGVEQHWWTSAAPCGSSGEVITSTQDLMAALQKKPVKSCGDIDWTLFGVARATYNGAASLGFAVAARGAWRKLVR